jgi:hypothetical protein
LLVTSVNDNEEEKSRKGANQEEVKMTRENFQKVSRIGTIEHSFMKIAQEITSSYVMQTLNDYV